ncbi:hypothetical protein MSG28_011454 [Choristoneura fumiferana]|uniref:Uncharacterized protein n=1 Tax=Choristoneura fumiferana TaxID=7141 RepID=A0ACC0JNA4_CHOFU|nr:hypothetical protein MSG28_011454 [Choristoneura fumiferana]
MKTPMPVQSCEQCAPPTATSVSQFFGLCRFEALKKMIRQEHVRELQRKYETEQKQELKELAAGRGDGKKIEAETRGQHAEVGVETGSVIMMLILFGSGILKKAIALEDLSQATKNGEVCSWGTSHPRLTPHARTIALSCRLRRITVGKLVILVLWLCCAEARSRKAHSSQHILAHLRWKHSLKAPEASYLIYSKINDEDITMHDIPNLKQSRCPSDQPTCVGVAVSGGTGDNLDPLILR